MQIPKILTILPYKENYTKSKAQAAAIWVYDFLKYSRYKKNTIVVGNTKTYDYLSKNYLNINIDNLASKFSSSVNTSSGKSSLTSLSLFSIS